MWWTAASACASPCGAVPSGSIGDARTVPERVVLNRIEEAHVEGLFDALRLLLWRWRWREAMGLVARLDRPEIELVQLLDVRWRRRACSEQRYDL